MVAYLYPIPDLGSLDNSVRPYMDEIRYSNWVECELSNQQISSSRNCPAVCQVSRREERNVPFVNLPWGSYDTSFPY